MISILVVRLALTGSLIESMQHQCNFTWQGTVMGGIDRNTVQKFDYASPEMNISFFTYHARIQPSSRNCMLSRKNGNLTAGHKMFCSVQIGI